MKQIILLFSLYTGIQNIYAQSDTIHQRFKNKIGFEIGYNHEFLKDIVFSPLNYSGGGSLISFNYQRFSNKNKSILLADFNLIANSLNTNASDLFTSSQLNGNMEIAYLRRIPKYLNPKTTFFVGASYITDISHMDWSGLTRSYFASHGFALKGMLFYQFKPKHQIQTSLTIPVAQIVVRPPYNGFDKETEELYENNIIGLIFNGQLTSINNYFGLFWKTTYTIPLSRRWDLDFSYTLNYKRTFEENKLIQLNNIFTSTINYKF